MWEDIHNSQETKEDTTWIAAGMKTGTLIWTTDRSYNRKRATNLSGVRWIIFCRKSGLRLTGMFWEKSPLTSSVCAKMLGLCALHLFACTIAEFHHVTKWTATMSCNNKCSLELSPHHQGRIHPSAKCADIRRSFRVTKQSYTRSFKYVHIDGLMDKYLSWGQLGLMPQLTCIYDILVKQTAAMAIIHGYNDRPTQILPHEIYQAHSISMQAKRWRKSTSNTKRKTSGPASNSTKFVGTTLIALKTKPDMCTIWQSKQASGFCGT
jgi:hypothetical protein